MRLGLVSLNVLALGVLLGAAWLVLTANHSLSPLPEPGRSVVMSMFGLGAAACLLAAVQFSGRRRMNAWGAITPMLIGAVLLCAGFAWLLLYATGAR